MRPLEFRAWAWLSLALLMEGAAVWQAVLQEWLVGTTLHTGACLFGLAGVLAWLKTRSIHAPGGAWFVLPLMFFIPAIGLVGLVCALIAGITHPRVPPVDRIMLTPVPDLPFKPLSFDSRLAFSHGGLFDVLKHSRDVDKRVTAVLATTRMKDRESIPLLKLAMRDEVDDVRLLAYSLKENKENVINAAIKKLRSTLKKTPPAEQAPILRSLAFLYWEPVYLGLAEGEVRQYLLTEADRHTTDALKTLEDGALHALHGRIKLAMEDYDGAQAAFEKARDVGLPLSATASYLAETAFAARQFALVPVYLRLIDRESRKREPMADVVRYWLGPA